MQSSKPSTSLFYNFLLLMNYWARTQVLYQRAVYFFSAILLQKCANNHYILDVQIPVSHNELKWLFVLLLLSPFSLPQFRQIFCQLFGFLRNGYQIQAFLVVVHLFSLLYRRQILDLHPPFFLFLRILRYPIAIHILFLLPTEHLLQVSHPSQILLVWCDLHFLLLQVLQ